jgi:hypothetical protein
VSVDAVAARTIWRGVFPAQLPTDGLDFEQLARLILSR